MDNSIWEYLTLPLVVGGIILFIVIIIASSKWKKEDTDIAMILLPIFGIIIVIPSFSFYFIIGKGLVVGLIGVFLICIGIFIRIDRNIKQYKRERKL